MSLLVVRPRKFVAKYPPEQAVSVATIVEGHGPAVSTARSYQWHSSPLQRQLIVDSTETIQGLLRIKQLLVSLDLKDGCVETRATAIHDHVLSLQDDASSVSRRSNMVIERMDRYIGRIDDLIIQVDRSIDMMRSVHAPLQWELWYSARHARLNWWEVRSMREILSHLLPCSPFSSDPASFGASLPFHHCYRQIDQKNLYFPSLPFVLHFTIIFLYIEDNVHVKFGVAVVLSSIVL